MLTFRHFGPVIPCVLALGLFACTKAEDTSAAQASGGSAGSAGTGGSTGGSAGTGGSTGGSAGTGGSTGGSAGTGGSGGSSATGGTGGTPDGGAGAPSQAWQFYAIGDPRSNWGIFEDNVRSMWALDPTAIGTFSAGDLTPTGARDEWDDHQDALANGAPDDTVAQDPLGIVRQSHFRTDVDDWGPYNRYIGVFGNHDDGVANWLTNWNDYLPGQAHLGENSTDGIYFTLSYDNALFIVLDSVHSSSAQTAWLKQVLEGSSAEWKFVFFHHAVYPCNYKTPFSRGLDWVTLFETHGVDIVFVGDSHTYERTCPMVNGQCASTGVIYLNSSGAGAGTRDVFADLTATVTRGDRTDEYDCADILESHRGKWHHFTHVAIEGCRLTTNAYSHDHHATQEAPFDTLEIDKCK